MERREHISKDIKELLKSLVDVNSKQTSILERMESQANRTHNKLDVVKTVVEKVDTTVSIMRRTG